MLKNWEQKCNFNNFTRSPTCFYALFSYTRTPLPRQPRYRK